MSHSGKSKEAQTPRIMLPAYAIIVKVQTSTLHWSDREALCVLLAARPSPVTLKSQPLPRPRGHNLFATECETYPKPYKP